MTQFIIVGGGIAGLAAAYYACQKSEDPSQIVLLEQASYWGGKIVTERNSDTVYSTIAGVGLLFDARATRHGRCSYQ